MDIARPELAKAKRMRRIIYGSAAVLLLIGVTLGLSKLKPAAPTVDRSTVWSGTVARGNMLREVRGLGTLVPEDIRWNPRAVQRQGGPHRSALGRHREAGFDYSRAFRSATSG